MFAVKLSTPADCLFWQNPHLLPLYMNVCELLVRFVPLVWFKVGIL